MAHAVHWAKSGVSITMAMALVGSRNLLLNFERGRVFLIVPSLSAI